MLIVIKWGVDKVYRPEFGTVDLKAQIMSWL